MCLPFAGHLLVMWSSRRFHGAVMPCAIACAKNSFKVKNGVYTVNIYVHSVLPENH